MYVQGRAKYICHKLGVPKPLKEVSHPQRGSRQPSLYLTCTNQKTVTLSNFDPNNYNNNKKLLCWIYQGSNDHFPFIDHTFLCPTGHIQEEEKRLTPLLFHQGYNLNRALGKRQLKAAECPVFKRNGETLRFS